MSFWRWTFVSEVGPTPQCGAVESDSREYLPNSGQERLRVSATFLVLHFLPLDQLPSFVLSRWMLPHIAYHFFLDLVYYYFWENSAGCWGPPEFPWVDCGLVVLAVCSSSPCNLRSEKNINILKIYKKETVWWNFRKVLHLLFNWFWQVCNMR